VRLNHFIKLASINLALVGAIVLSGAAHAQSAEQRLQRLERFLDNSALIGMLQEMESLQNEVRQLRGALEERDNAIGAMRERQRKLYLDTDSRIAALESGGGGGGGSLNDLDDLDDLDDLADLEDLDDFDSPGSGGSEVSLSSLSSEPQSVPVPRVDEQREKLDYQNAYDLLILGRNREAIAGFGNFLQRYPNGTYSDNAHYWLGEANYVERQFSEAIDRFNVVIFQFPASRKVPDARLRKGFALYELQRYGEARQELAQVESEYRGRSIAALARRRIDQMNSAGL